MPTDVTPVYLCREISAVATLTIMVKQLLAVRLSLLRPYYVDRERIAINIRVFPIPHLDPQMRSELGCTCLGHAVRENQVAASLVQGMPVYALNDWSLTTAIASLAKALRGDALLRIQD
jgi:hypothetical protein